MIGKKGRASGERFSPGKSGGRIETLVSDYKEIIGHLAEIKAQQATHTAEIRALKESVDRERVLQEEMNRRQAMHTSTLFMRVDSLDKWKVYMTGAGAVIVTGLIYLKEEIKQKMGIK